VIIDSGPFVQSSVDVSFWSELGSKKLDEYQLSETPIDITGGRLRQLLQQLQRHSVKHVMSVATPLLLLLLLLLLLPLLLVLQQKQHLSQTIKSSLAAHT
jgi:hypothetical protein